MHAMLLLVACNLLVNRTPLLLLLLLLLLFLLGLSKGKRNDDHAVNFHLYKIVELEHNKKKAIMEGRLTVFIDINHYSSQYSYYFSISNSIGCNLVFFY
jgi:hypothetical protein